MNASLATVRSPAGFATGVTLLALFVGLTGCPGGDDDDCTPTGETLCETGTVYALDSCGGRRSQETCQCGCNAPETACESCIDPTGCTEILDCANACADQACVDACIAAGDTAAQPLFNTLWQCLDTACGADATCRSDAAHAECSTPNAACSDCTQSCTGRECGDDACGGVCGLCGVDQTCSAAGQCEGACTPATCEGLGVECDGWDDGCGGTTSCGPCQAGFSCSTAGTCLQDCVPETCQSLGVECGQWNDGCGGQQTCPTCPLGESCVTGTCVPDTVPRPVLTLASQNQGAFTLDWTFSWPGLCNSGFRYDLEESTTGPTTGFSVVLSVDHGGCSSSWSEPLTRSTAGIYYYRVVAIGGSTQPSNVVAVTVVLQPPVLRIVNDLYDTLAGPNDWSQMNQLFRIWMADDFNALNQCNDVVCDRLAPALGSMPGQVIYPDTSENTWEEFDVSMYSDGDYCVYLQTGWWDYFCAPNCYWSEHSTNVVCCDGVNTCLKWNTFCVNGHFSGTFTVNASDWLPVGNWAGDPLCP